MFTITVKRNRPVLLKKVHLPKVPPDLQTYRYINIVLSIAMEHSLREYCEEQRENCFLAFL